MLVAAWGTIWHYGGWLVLEIIAGVTAILIVAVRPARQLAVQLFEAIAVPHRLRSGLIQAGVTDRRGRPPWLMWAWPKANSVWVTSWLNSGVTIDDLRGAAAVVGTACGAIGIEVVQPSLRQDRAIIKVMRPRWGLLAL